ncbi:uncharacterized protein LOC132313906 [Cornus florida]|uniref:uncharacterized protein LOC132313906 n=1 Tax=Cornus florida TaxID=4283 RepID=UPI00289BCBF4|nr:uncharacterized protein LOC132313906 [Cornus florida]
MVMSWLWNAMVPEISDTVMFLTTAQEIWEAIRQTYSKKNDAAQVYEIKVKLAATKQRNKTVTEYANTLKNLWYELDYYQVLEMKNSEDAVLLKAFIEKDRIYDFLAGFNSEFDTVRVQTLGKGLSSLNEAIATIRAEESRRGVMLDSQPLEGSALLTTAASEQTLEKKSSTTTDYKKSAPKRTFKENLVCNYCKKTCHTKDTCYKLHGRPQNMNQLNRNSGGRSWQQKGQAHVAQNSTNNTSNQPNSNSREFCKEDIDRHRSFLIHSKNLQDRASGKTIGLAKEKDGLYCLEPMSEKGKVTSDEKDDDADILDFNLMPKLSPPSLSPSSATAPASVSFGSPPTAASPSPDHIHSQVSLPNSDSSFDIPPLQNPGVTPPESQPQSPPKNPTPLINPIGTKSL